MIKVKKEGILLKKTHFEFENEGVLNPAVIREGVVLSFTRRCKESFKPWLLQTGWAVDRFRKVESLSWFRNSTMRCTVLKMRVL
jgi:hypothetical protein